jgi:AhpD family alkylhydroperoxidase
LLRLDYRVVFPDAIHPLEDIERHVRASGIERTLIAMVGMRASQLNGCLHCVDRYAQNAAALGEDDQRLIEVSTWLESDRFSPRQRAALRWTDLLTMLPLSEDLSEAFDELSQQFQPKEVVALTAAVIAANSWNRLHLGLGEPSGPVAYAEPIPDLTHPRVRKLAARLSELEVELASVREAYRRAVEGHPGPRWYESGTIHPELDDPAIAP